MRHSCSRTGEEIFRKLRGNWNWGNPNRRDPAAGQTLILITFFLVLRDRIPYVLRRNFDANSSSVRLVIQKRITGLKKIVKKR